MAAPQMDWAQAKAEFKTRLDAAFEEVDFEGACRAFAHKLQLVNNQQHSELKMPPPPRPRLSLGTAVRRNTNIECRLGTARTSGDSLNSRDAVQRLSPAKVSSPTTTDQPLVACFRWNGSQTMMRLLPSYRSALERLLQGEALQV